MHCWNKCKTLRTTCVAVVVLFLCGLAVRHYSAEHPVDCESIAAAQDRYQWRDDGHLLLFQMSDRQTALTQLSFSSSGEHTIVPLLLKLRGGTGSDIRVSPDGDRLFIHTQDDMLLLYSLIGGPPTIVSKNWSNIAPLWMPDSTHWLELPVRPTRKSNSVPVIHAIPLTSAENRAPIDAKSVQMLVSNHAVLTTDGRLIDDNIGGRDELYYALEPRIVLEELVVGTGRVTHRRVINAPRGFIIDDALSRDGNRLCVVVAYHPGSVLSSLLGRLLNHGLVPTLRAAMYVINLPTGSVDELGTANISGELEDFDAPHDFQWRPDGRAISYIHHDRLMLVRAP